MRGACHGKGLFLFLVARVAAKEEEGGIDSRFPLGLEFDPGNSNISPFFQNTLKGFKP